MMHILIISQYFYPEAFRINDMALEWVRRGCKVTVLTGIPNYPAGRFYEGYGYTKKRCERWNGIRIIRIPVLPRGTGLAGMAGNYISFVASGFLWNMLTRIRADLVFIFEVSPMTQALAGVWYGKKHQVPVFLYAQDLWPENVELVTGIHHPALLKPVDCMVDYIYRHTDEIFATSRSFVSAIISRRVRVSPKKVHYWPQYAEEFYQPLDASQVLKEHLVPEIPDDDSFKIVFTGNIGYAQGLDILPKAAVILKEEAVTFVMVGSGRYEEAFKKSIAQKKAEDKFILIPRQDAGRIPAMLARCDVAYLSYPDPKTIPAKLQSYMACGKCILASAGAETEKILASADCGICCSFGKEEELAQAVRFLMDRKKEVCRMGKNARNYYLKHFEKSRLMDQMDAYFRKYMQNKGDTDHAKCTDYRRTL